MSSTDKHVFAIYVPTFWNKNYQVNTILKVVDLDIVHRLVKVLRVQIGERFIFFDSNLHGLIEIVAISKKDFSVKIITITKNIPEAFRTVFLLPLLKKEALEEAVYSLAEIGVSEIQLVITQKSRQKLLHEKEFQRLEAIVISAAEQSKNYAFPKIQQPVHLFDYNFKSDQQKFVFDPQGKSFFDLNKTISKEQEILLLVGPEGGLTEDEFRQLESYLFEKCCLTPTILRAVQAVALGSGLFKLL